MRIRIAHKTTYKYAEPASGAIQTLRLTPRNHDGQYVIDWRIDISEDCRLVNHEDAFGNITHTFTVDGSFAELEVTADGEVETTDLSGFVRGTVERFPPSLFLRQTALTEPDAAILAFAREIKSKSNNDVLELLHLLLNEVHRTITFDVDQTGATTTAVEAFAAKRGVCQDLTHIFVAAARALDIPARYVGGYFYRQDGVVAQAAGHAWAEAHVPHIGWIGFDPANGICPADAHVRVAIGLDYLGVAPVRGTRFGGRDEQLLVGVHVEQAQRQVQNQ